MPGRDRAQGAAFSGRSERAADVQHRIEQIACTRHRGPGRGGVMRLTIAEAVAVRALSHPDRVAIREMGGDSLTYGQVWRRVLALAGPLAGCPAGPHGRMVGLLLPNGADAALAYLACQVAGVTAVPLNSRLAEPELAFILDDSGTGLVLTDGALAEVAARVAGTRRVLRSSDLPTPETAERPLLGEGGRGEAPAAIAYTSGTTGLPKGAIWSNDHFLVQIMRWGWEFGLTADTVMLVPGPLFHLSYCGLTLGALCMGAQALVMPAFDPAAALDAFCADAAFAFLVPAMTGAILEEWAARGEPDIPAARFIISSGAPGPLAMTQKAMRMFRHARVAEAYGWTEGGWCTFEVKDPATLLAHSVGWPTFGNEVQVFGADGEPAAPGEPGEVGVKSLTHFGGYLGRPEATEAAWHRGYAMSGDIGIWQPDGRLCIVDRKKDMIITGGENVYTAEVERVLHDHPQVLEAAVVGLPDARWGERVCAMVVARAPAPDASELTAFCRRHLAAYKVPKQVEIRAELPRNSMGKVQKFRIVEALTGAG